jgi:hypothetical protein
MNPNYSSKAFSQLTHNELSKKSAIHDSSFFISWIMAPQYGVR